MENKEFIDSYKQIAKRAIETSDKIRREGSLALEKFIDKEKINERDIFELGLSFMIDGTERKITNNILSNIVNQEKDEQLNTLKTIQKEAILAIYDGINSYLLRHLINSYTSLNLDEDEIFNSDD